MTRPIELNGLDIILTYECTGRCAHCCYRAAPGHNQTMAVAEVEGYLSAVAGHPLEWILLFGGEPFACYDLLRASVLMAAPMAGVLVFTNGCWATDPDTASHWLADLQAVGLDHILFSVDAFHQAHVPLERIAIGIEAAQALGFGRIEVDNCWWVGPERDNPFDRRTRDSVARLADLCDLSGVDVGHSLSRKVGRAADTVAATASMPAPLASLEVCALPGYLGGDLCAPTTVEIHPGGWVNLCAGLAVGNAQQQPLGDILAGYDPDAHPIIRVLDRDGPVGLRRLAQERGYESVRDPVDSCHLCYNVRRFLHPYYPGHLAPAHVYAGDDRSSGGIERCQRSSPS